jgi:methionyl-tRNA formyltransferase
MSGVSGLRLIMMGTGPFAVPTFEALRGGPHEIVAVVTRPDRAPAGRRPPPNPMRAAAGAAGIPVLDPERVNEPAAVAALAALRPDLLVVCDYGQILSAGLLAVAPLGGINLHGSLLPRHRGAAPVQWTILEGDAVAGVSVFHMTPALDAGRLLAMRSTPVAPRETAAELEPRLARLGVEAVVEAIEILATVILATGARAGTLASVGTPQDAAGVTRAPRLAKADGVVDWTQPAAAIERRRRALEPWPRLATFFTRGDGQRSRLVIEECAENHTTAPDAPDVAPGTVIEAAGDRFVVACGGGTALEILRLVPEGRRSMSAAEFLRGSPLHAGSRLG